ncbi:hypothetical protein P3T37_006043 [Kitasatospora sp. MAA4]|nr:hypothetical protein [Kitasatospora sp. MAA4]
MSSSTPAQSTVPMRALLAATAAAAAVCTPPRPGDAVAERGDAVAGRGDAVAGRRRAQAITITRVPVGAKSQSV